MTFRFSVLLLTLFASVAPCAAQTLTPRQQAVVDSLTRCYDGWVQSFVDRSFSTFANACPQTNEAAFWYTDSDAPVSYGGAGGLWASLIGETSRYAWRDLRPISVLIDADLALIYFTVTWRRTPISGDAVEATTRRMNVFRQENGEWRMIGGMMTTIR